MNYNWSILSQLPGYNHILPLLFFCVNSVWRCCLIQSLASASASTWTSIWCWSRSLITGQRVREQVWVAQDAYKKSVFWISKIWRLKQTQWNMTNRYLVCMYDYELYKQNTALGVSSMFGCFSECVRNMMGWWSMWWSQQKTDQHLSSRGVSWTKTAVYTRLVTCYFSCPWEHDGADVILFGSSYL